MEAKVIATQMLGERELGTNTMRALGRAGFGSKVEGVRRETYEIPLEQLFEATDEELLGIKWIGSTRLQKIRSIDTYIPTS